MTEFEKSLNEVMSDLHNKHNQKFYLEVPYDEKERAKQHGAKWDNTNKKWYITWHQHDTRGKSIIDDYFIEYLDVPYNQRDEYKAKGFKWDKDVRKWYTYSGNPHLNNMLFFNR